MIKTIAIPQKNSYNLSIPSNYIGKKIEIIFYALDEVIEEKSAKKSMSDFWGKISNETANDLHNQVDENRKTWEGRLNK